MLFAFYTKTSRRPRRAGTRLIAAQRAAGAARARPEGPSLPGPAAAVPAPRGDQPLRSPREIPHRRPRPTHGAGKATPTSNLCLADDYYYYLSSYPNRTATKSCRHKVRQPSFALWHQQDQKTILYLLVKLNVAISNSMFPIEKFMNSARSPCNIFTLYPSTKERNYTSHLSPPSFQR